MLSKKEYGKLKFLINLAFFAALAILVYLAFHYIFGAIAPFIIAFIAASLVEPLVRFLCKKAKMPRGVASPIGIVLLLIAIVVLGAFLSTTIWTESKSMIAAIPGQIKSLILYLKSTLENGTGIFASIPEGYLNKALDYLSNYDYTSLFTGSIGSAVLGYAGDIVTYIPNALIFFIVTIVSSVFMSASFPTVKRFCLAQFKREHQELILDIKRNLFATVGKYLRSYFLLMFITFVELLIFFLIFDFNPALPLAFLIAIIDILPVLGVGTVLIPWSVICLLIGKPWTALILACMYIVITIIRQILEPKIIGDHVGMLPILTLFCIWVGLKVFGFIGMFMVPITVVILKNLHESGKIHLWQDINMGGSKNGNTSTEG